LPSLWASDTIIAMCAIPLLPRHRLLWLFALLLGLAALSWYLLYRQQMPSSVAKPIRVESLGPGQVATMDSPFFNYDPDWQLSATGADPVEPADPWTEPSGRISFDYEGKELALLLAEGNYWGFLYVTVDGEAANQLPVILGNRNSRGEISGYKPLLAPEKQTAAGPTPQWIVVHTAADQGPHRVEVELWRSWGQIPVRGAAVDALPSAPLPLWPAVAFGLLALGMALWRVDERRKTKDERKPTLNPQSSTIATNIQLPAWASLPDAALLPLLAVALLLISAGVLLDQWLVTNTGLLLLGMVGLQRPLLWTGALLFGLPFYLYPLPILPGRAFNLVEIGIWGGLAILAARWVWTVISDQLSVISDQSPVPDPQSPIPNPQSPVPSPQSPVTNPHLFLAALIGLALVAAFAADQRAVALREWRTVFVAAGGFALLLAGSLRSERHPYGGWTLITFWLLGGTVVSLAALWQYGSGQMLIEAEGVNRVRGFYGSPNNLALYLERTVAVGLALALVGAPQAVRIPHSAFRIPQWFWWILILPQLAALLLTFSKGAIVLALPAILVILGLSVFWLPQADRPRLLWGLAAVALLVIVGMAPFLGTERLRSLFDFSAGSTGGLRLNLWRSSLSMALDHPWLGVGPDNFLYAYRSGYILPAAWQDPSLNHPHNVLFDWWTRLGVGGLILAVGWLLKGSRRLWLGISDPARTALNLGCLAAVAGALAHGLIDASYALPDLMLVWVLLLSVNSDQ
jgi:O-antigen ligase